MSRVVWVYYVSRDSIAGDLSGMCHLWYAKPLRTRIGNRVTWVAADHRDPCHLGEFLPKIFLAWFHVYPETDLELIRVEQYPTKTMLDEARKAKK